jgi:hypothetical protein
MKKPILAATSAISLTILALFWAGAFSTVATIPGCADSGGGGKKCKIVTNLDKSVCGLTTGSFGNPTNITNPYFPLTPDDLIVLDGEEGGVQTHLEIEVTSQTRFFGGIQTVVVVETATEDGVTVEVAVNYFAQADDKTVCYFGEKVDNYENGVIANHDGSWLAGVGDNVPGIIMPAAPKLGDAYAQENAPDIANDLAEVTAVGESLSTPGGDFTRTIRTTECSPLEKNSYEDKVYAKGVGIVYDNGLYFTSKTP